MIIKRKQKDYSLVSDLYHSGIKRTGKKYIGRTRVKIANALQKSIEKNELEKAKTIRDIRRPRKVNPDIKSKLTERANKEFDTAVVSGDRTEITSREGYLDRFGIYRQAAKNEIGNHKSVISLGSGSQNNLALAHELGHISNNDLTSETKSVIRRERNANKKAYKFLKDSGATKDEIREAKELGKKTEKTYKLRKLADNKRKVRDKVELPSWKYRTERRILRDRFRREVK